MSMCIDNTALALWFYDCSFYHGILMKYSAGVFAKLSITRCQKCTGHDVLDCFIFSLWIILDFLGGPSNFFCICIVIDLLLLNDTKTY